MFESDDCDQILSQFDFEEELNTHKPSSNLQAIPHLNNKVVSLSDNEFMNVPTKRQCPIAQNLSPIHTKRKIIDSHFNHKNKRKFPGPAGLLMGTLQETKDDSMCQMELLSQDINASQCHLQSEIFNTPLWNRLLKDTRDFSCNTIKTIKEQAFAGNLRGKKAEIVRGFVETIDRSASDPLITLRDNTGHIKCTLHRDAWSHFSPYIVPDYCALVLSKPTVLTTGGAYKKHYLNITIANISHIYSSNTLNVGDALPDGYVKILDEDFTLIEREKHISEFAVSSLNDINDDILEDLDGAFSDIF